MTGAIRRRHPVVSQALLPGQIRAICINLKERSDRRASTVREFEKAPWVRLEFFEARKNANGMLGCSLSHVDVLSSDPEGGVVLVCEDDIQFLGAKENLEDTVGEFLSNPAIDVLCLANVSPKRVQPISKRLGVTAWVRTTAGYLVKERAVPAMLSDFQRSAFRLRLGLPGYLAAADVSWERSQWTKLIFAVPLTPVARQRPSYSDIEQRWVDYDAETS